MKLYYDKKSKNPTYFIQEGIRNGKKTTTRNVKRIGKHSELLAIIFIFIIISFDFITIQFIISPLKINLQ